VYYRYTGKRKEHGRILTSMWKLGIKRGISKNITIDLMAKKKVIEPVSTDF